MISVVMPVFNGEGSIVASMESVLSQDYPNIELIIVDDGSTDGLGRIAREYERKDLRVRALKQDRQGITRALIFGCREAAGEFIARQDVGDVSLPSRLQKQAELLATTPELAFVACQFVPVGPGGEVLGDAQPADGGEEVIASLLQAPSEGMKSPHHGSVMFRRAVYEKVGGYRPEFYFAQDLDLWSRMIEVGDLGFVEEVLYEVSFTPGSITARHRPQQFLLRDLIREATLLRRSGRPEDGLLQRAARVRPDSAALSRRAEADAQYFIGSCLHRRGDPAAAAYLLRALASNPFHLKAWVKLLGNRMRQYA